MDRRELLEMIAVVTGVSMVGPMGALAYELPPADPTLTPRLFDAQGIALLDLIAETILPRTDTPGAADANTGQIMAVLIEDCYTTSQQAAVLSGLSSLREQAVAESGVPFEGMSAEQRLTLLRQLDAAAKQADQDNGIRGGFRSSPASRDEHDTGPLPHYFTLLKQLAIFGFFTSKTGATEVLRFVETPGSYDGDYAYKKGDRAWAT